MPTPAEQLKTILDAAVSVAWPSLVVTQEAYLAAHGTFWQGLRTPTMPPADGAPATIDPTLKPSDVEATWADAERDSGVSLAGLPAQVQMDVYDGPAGKGFWLTLRFEASGVTYSRAWSYGPEDHSHGWTEEEG